MDIKFECAQCGQRIAIDESAAGLTVQCPQCQQNLVVPSPSKVIVPKIVAAPPRELQFIIVNFQQGTPEWREWRHSGIGASDAPVIMGENPWKTAAELLREKRGAVREREQNEAMARGNQLEPQARARYAVRTGKNVNSACLQNRQFSWLRASVDGITSDGNAVVEIKCGEKVYNSTVQSGRPPDYYYGQLQHTLAVTGLASIDFWCFLPDQPEVLIHVNRDDDYIKRLIIAEQEFWNKIERKSKKPIRQPAPLSTVAPNSSELSCPRDISATKMESQEIKHDSIFSSPVRRKRRRKKVAPSPTLTGWNVVKAAFGGLFANGSKGENTPLHWAASNGDYVTAQSLLAKGAKANAKDQNGATPLYWAALQGHYDVVELLLSYGADMQAKNAYGRTPFYYAFSRGHKAIAELFLSRGLNINAREETGQTYLHTASIPEATFLLSHGADVNAKNGNGLTPLHLAVIESNNKPLTELLLAKGADINAKMDDGATLLHNAAECGDSIAVEFLLARGANVSVKDSAGRTPLHIVMWKNFEAVAALLLDKGADINAKNIEGRTALHEATASKKYSAVEFLLSRGANPNAKDNEATTPLHLAASKGGKAAVKLLLAKGAEVNVVDKNGTTPLQLAIANDRKLVAKLLESLSG